MVSARGKFNPKSQEFCEDWAPEYVQQFDAGRRELGKENSYFQSSVKDSSANTSGMSQAISLTSPGFPNPKIPHATPTANSC